MCGITGTVDASDRYVDRDRLLAMCRKLCHRGPDDEGMYLGPGVGLAVRRLAVIDVAGGRQPVSNETGTVHAVVNGEIYNYRELRRSLARRGHRFSSASDCEVIPHLYEEYGDDFPSRLEGMFALALWDAERRQLLLGRDRVGIKPLHYLLRPPRLTFGSEIRSILAAAEGTTTVDLQALTSYLSLMYIPGPRTIYADIRKLEPGTTLIWSADGHTVRRYWDLLTVPRDADLSPADAQRTLRRLLAESVEGHMMADVPVGFFLSGGLDSSSIVATARHLRPDDEIKTFTVGFVDRSYDERRHAALVSEQLRTNHTELIVEPRPDDVVDRILPSFDEPFADPSMVPTYYLCELARSQVTAALGGDGGDELFAGYLSYTADKLAQQYRHLPRPLTERIAPAMLRFLPTSYKRASLDFKARRFIENALAEPSLSHYLWRVVFRENHKAQLLSSDVYAGLVDSYETHERFDVAGRFFDDLTRRQYTDVNVYLADNVLTKVDRLSMAHSLEARVPLLATSLIEFAFSLPGRLKMPGYQPKRLMRDAMRGTLPARILSTGKKGFNAPLPRWLAGQFRSLVDEVLSAEVLRRHGYLQPEEVARWVRRHMDGTAEHSREIWILLMFSLWVEEHKAYR